VVLLITCTYYDIEKYDQECV